MNLANFDAIMAEYDKKQIHAHHMLKNRKDQVYDQIPSYKALEDEITSLRLSQAKANILGEHSRANELKLQVEALILKKPALLKEHGFSPDYLEAVYECKDCKDTGYLPDKTKCHCLVQKINNLHFNQSGLAGLLETENFEHLSFDYYEGKDLEHFKKIYTKARNYVEEFANTYRNLFFYGNVGSGKSFLSCCIAKEILKQGYEVFYFSSVSLFDTLANFTFRSADKQELAGFTERLKQCDLLIIDDLGTELTNAFVSSELFTILNERDFAKKATIISSNIRLEDLRDQYSDRIFSRVISNYDIVRFEGDDIRKQKKLISNQEKR